MIGIVACHVLSDTRNEARRMTTQNNDPIYPQDAQPWYVQIKIQRDDWRTVGIVPRARHTRSEAVARYQHLADLRYVSDTVRLRAVSYAQAKADYEAGRAHRPDAIR